MTAVPELPWRELDANLRTFIGRRVRSGADVDDLVQRVLLQIVKGVGSLREADRLYAWVYRTARNVIADYYRAPAARREIASGSAADLERIEPAGRPLVAAGDEDEGEAIRELAVCLEPMLRQLTPAYREAVALADLQGVDQAHAAKLAGVSLSGMKSRVQRGRRQLKAVLEECCRVELDRRGSIVGYERQRGARSCDDCG